jgi:hypothetical protein
MQGLGLTSSSSCSGSCHGQALEQERLQLQAGWSCSSQQEAQRCSGSIQVKWPP